MDIQAYISSGILERYALGLCSAAEAREVEALSAAHPEIDKEIEAIRSGLELYAQSHAVPPPPALKDKLMQRISKQENTNPEKGRIISLSETKKPGSAGFTFPAYAAAAIAVLLISSVALNMVLYTTWKSTEKQLSESKQENTYTAEKLKAQEASYKETAKDLALLKNPDVVKMELKGKDPAPDAKALVYRNMKTNEIFLDIKTMPAAPDSMQYQFWAIVDGKPVDAGMIELCKEPDTCFIHKMNTVPNAQAFAISLEKKGGNPAPQGRIYAAYGI